MKIKLRGIISTAIGIIGMILFIVFNSKTTGMGIYYITARTGKVLQIAKYPALAVMIIGLLIGICFLVKDVPEVVKAAGEKKKKKKAERETMEHYVDKFGTKYASQPSNVMETAYQPQTSPITPQPMFCPGCGKKFNNGDKFCNFCGQKLD